MKNNHPLLKVDIERAVTAALAEDIGDGDITAALIPADQNAKAQVITREDCVIAGRPWVDEVFAQLDRQRGCKTTLHWRVNDGDRVEAKRVLFELEGNARSLLTGERTALNFLQLLSGTASRCAHYVDRVKHTQVKLLDTRKTIPGLRTAQKYAVTCGGGYNHRMGLFDAFLIKENHIAACGGIAKAVATARQMHPGKPVEVEVENLEELKVALESRADIVMLDNFSVKDMEKGVAINREFASHAAKLEASGGINEETLVTIAETGVDFISMGGLTKDCLAVDLSMRV
jgi:nicotinate-nucleotide pyrophosphorylase (carboxylating)